MTKKIEAFVIFPNDFPENIVTIKAKILFIVHNEGVVKTPTFMIKDHNLGSIRQATLALKKGGMFKTFDDSISLSEAGLREHEKHINSEVSIHLTNDEIIKFFSKNIDKAIGTKDLCKHFGLDRKRKYILNIKLKELKNSGIIVQFSNYSNYRTYYLTDSDKGREILKELGEVVVDNSFFDLNIIFQKALPGTLTGGDLPKPFLY